MKKCNCDRERELSALKKENALLKEPFVNHFTEKNNRTLAVAQMEYFCGKIVKLQDENELLYKQLEKKEGEE